MVPGDFNIAPEDRDVHDPGPLAGAGAVLRRGTPGVPRLARRSALRDSFRLFEQPEKTFSWWDYRQLAFPKNRGLRIDHILLSPALAARCTSCRIDRNARKGESPSDHAPVIVELDASRLERAAPLRSSGSSPSSWIFRVSVLRPQPSHCAASSR